MRDRVLTAPVFVVVVIIRTSWGGVGRTKLERI